mgnify:CR=1 FL=1
MKKVFTIDRGTGRRAAARVKNRGAYVYALRKFAGNFDVVIADVELAKFEEPRVEAGDVVFRRIQPPSWVVR